MPFQPTNASTNLYDAMPVVMAASQLVENSGLPALADMMNVINAQLAVDDFLLTVPSYSDYGIGSPGGRLVLTALSWKQPTLPDARDGGLEVFKSAFTSSIALSHTKVMQSDTSTRLS